MDGFQNFMAINLYYSSKKHVNRQRFNLIKPKTHCIVSEFRKLNNACFLYSIIQYNRVVMININSSFKAKSIEGNSRLIIIYTKI